MIFSSASDENGSFSTMVISSSVMVSQLLESPRVFSRFVFGGVWRKRCLVGGFSSGFILWKTEGEPFWGVSSASEEVGGWENGNDEHQVRCHFDSWPFPTSNNLSMSSILHYSSHYGGCKLVSSFHLHRYSL